MAIDIFAEYMMDDLNKIFTARWALHLAVMLFGFTAVLGKLLTLNTFVLVWWRMVITLTGYLIWMYFRRQPLNIQVKQWPWHYVSIGTIIGIHWYCFYGSVKVSHISVALICMSFTTFFTCLFEPLILKKPFDWIDFCISILFIPLMYLVVNGVRDFNIWGFVLGLGAALFAAVFSLYNKKIISAGEDPMRLSHYEFIGVWMFCTPAALYYFVTDGLINHTPIFVNDIICIMLLAIVCTNIAYVMSINALKKTPVFEANLIVGLEPVYGILLAFYFFHENQYLNPSFYFGSILMLILTFAHPIIKSRILS